MKKIKMMFYIGFGCSVMALWSFPEESTGYYPEPTQEKAQSQEDQTTINENPKDNEVAERGRSGNYERRTGRNKSRDSDWEEY